MKGQRSQASPASDGSDPQPLACQAVITVAMSLGPPLRLSCNQFGVLSAGRVQAARRAAPVRTWPLTQAFSRDPRPSQL